MSDTARKWLWAIAVIAIGWAAMGILVNDNQASAIRDLQRRVDRLESERR